MSSLPKHIVDTVRAKFEQAPHAAQFKMQCVPDDATLFKLQRMASGDCVICKRQHNNDNAYLRLTRSGALFFHCRRAPGRAGIELFKQDMSLAVGIGAAPWNHIPLHASIMDITDDARCLTYRHLAPQLKSLELGQGMLDICEQQPPSLLICGAK